MGRLAKEKFNKDTPIKNYNVCKQDKKVYLETKVSNNDAEASIFCPKLCVKRGFGSAKNIKKVI